MVTASPVCHDRSSELALDLLILRASDMVTLKGGTFAPTRACVGRARVYVKACQDGGMLSWLYGPRSQPMVMFPGTNNRTTRNLLLDVETLIDLRDEIQGVLASQVNMDPTRPVRVEFQTLRGTVAPEDLAGLHVADKKQLQANYTYWDQVSPDGSQREQHIYIHSDNAGLNFTDERHAEQISRVVVDFLYRHGTQEINWARVRRASPLAFPAIALIAYVWLALTTSLPVAAHILILALVGSAIVASVMLMRFIRERSVLYYRYRYRGESRAQTEARRADERKNIKVAVITAVLTIIGGIVLAAALGWLQLGGSGNPSPGPSTSQTP